jgi:biofilm PGA synthesis N-glycosyltransferase PgaC
VLSQTIPPKKWVIVSDGSTDRTDEIVAGFAKQCGFITLVRAENRGKRSFSSKVNAFRMSAEVLSGVPYDFLGNLDADVSFPADYYESVLQRFHGSPRLGIAGGAIHELVKGRFEPQRNAPDSVAGAVQLFRRSCFESFGGYVPLRFGGIDSAAEIMARMHGWDVRTFPDLAVCHHRRVSSGTGGVIRTKLRYGMGHYCLGYHPLFEFIRLAHRVMDRPYFVGSGLIACGYLWAWFTRIDRGVPQEVVQYLRTEQKQKLRAMRGRSLRMGEVVEEDGPTLTSGQR